jgi:hypothetical protein
MNPSDPFTLAIIPFTVVASLCLVFTFVVFFVREQSRVRVRSVEAESLLPLDEETPLPQDENPHQKTCNCDCCHCHKKSPAAHSPASSNRAA